MPTKNLRKVAIIHDWLNGLRGGEIVLEAILELFPEAEIFTLFYHPGKTSPSIEKHVIHTSFLNKIFFVRKFYRFFLPLFPMAVERFDLSKFDLVISSSHCVAKGVIPSPNALHICYSHTPMRYAWDRYKDYFGKSKLWPLIFPFIHYLRMWDTLSSARVDHFIANSEWVKNRIRVFYRREAKVLNPFVDLNKFTTGGGDLGDYYLIASAFAPYKRLDLAIKACEKMKRKLLIVGDGQEAVKLKSLARKNTTFLGRVRMEELSNLYQGARALLFPGEEDFGITPLEAMASGRPIIGFNQGGLTDSVIHGETGILFKEQTVECLCEAILEFEKTEKSFKKETCRKQAERFSREKFTRNFSALIELFWENHVTENRRNIFSPEVELAP